MKTRIVTPWHNTRQMREWLDAWGLGNALPDWLILQHDSAREGCAKTKNKGIRAAIKAGAEMVVVLDDDCFPAGDCNRLEVLTERHAAALEPQDVVMFEQVTTPASRGTPYACRCVKMPVAASMGFWECVPDYDAPAQLVYGPTRPMQYKRAPVFGRYFPLCGMNLAFRVDWWPWCQFIDAPRFDDIWQGFVWQKEAYRRGHCFNLAGPVVVHARQSDVWANLRAEAPNMERNETMWKRVHELPEGATHEQALLALGLSV